MDLSIILAYLAKELNGEKVIIIVADNAGMTAGRAACCGPASGGAYPDHATGDMHNAFFFALPQLIVDAGLAERCMLVYWPAHHAKCEADRGARRQHRAVPPPF